MTDRLFIGLDAGTSVTKAAIFDTSGRQLAVAQRSTTIHRPQEGWSELDPRACWQAALEVITEVVTGIGADRRTIAGIGLSAAMVGAWVLDAQGTPLRPAITWEDSRAQGLIAAHIARDSQFLQRIFAASGSVMQQGCTLPVMAWLACHEPAVLARAAHVVSYKDYLHFRLTGRIATDRSEAAVLPGSTISRDRSAAMINLFGLDRHIHLLPPVEESETVLAGLLPKIAAHLGLPAGLPVTVGAGDVAATIIGAGGLALGTATAVLGTACMVGVTSDQPVFKPADIGLLFTLPGRRWYRAMLNVAGTSNLDWAFATLAPDLAQRPDRFAELDRMLDATPPGAQGLTYLPYLSDSGIIAPRVDRLARAQFDGLSPRHDRACLFRAVIEGVAFAIRDLLDALSFKGDRLLLVGGGAQNERWVQMICDVVGKPVIVPEGSQFGARGAALLAATAVGTFSDIVEAAASASSLGRIYQPDPTRAEEFAPAIARYCHVRDRLGQTDR